MVGAVWALGAVQSAADSVQDEAITKDLHITQTPMADLRPAPPPAEAASAAGGTVTVVPTIRVDASVDRGEGGTYRIGEDVVLAVEVSEDAHLWIYNTGSSGQVHQIFPNRFDRDNFVRGGETLTIPGADAQYDFRVGTPPGKDLVTVIATTSDTPLSGGLVKEAVGDGVFLAMAGTGATVAKDLSISLREHPVWERDLVVIDVVE